MPSRFSTTFLPVAAALALAASATLAAPPPEDETPVDARLEGFTHDGRPVAPLVITPPSSTAGTWFLTFGLGVLCFGVMCKNGKRTHLD